MSYGLIDLTRRDGHETLEPLLPGRCTGVRLLLDDLAHAFPAGHRTRLSLSNSY